MTYNLSEISSTGFLLFFGVAVVFGAISLIKYIPKILDAVKDVIMTFKDFSNSVGMNTEVTRKQYEESLSVKEQLRILNDKLISRDEKFKQHTVEHEEIIKISKEDHAETLRIIREIEKKVESFMEVLK